MIDYGIQPGDIAVISRRDEAVKGKIVVICIDGQNTLKLLLEDALGPVLLAGNQAYPTNTPWRRRRVGVRWSADRMPEAILKPSWRLSANQKRVYALVDCNSFYASCERHPLWRPDLAGLPIVVLSNNDGCVIARSKEAKALGYKMGDPFFKIRDQLASQRVQVFSRNYTLYDDLSNRVMLTLADFAADLEVYSIDEMFLDLTGMTGFQGMAEEMKNRVWRWTGIPVGVGISTTKTLAKLANWAAKNWKGLPGVAVVLDDRRHELLLKRAPIGVVWGIGRRWAEKLESRGITTAWHLACADNDELGREFNVVLQRTALELRGVPCNELELQAPPKKQIISSRAFGARQQGWRPVEQSIASYVARAAEKLRAQGSVCRRIDVGLVVRTATSESFSDAWSTASAKLQQHTDDTSILQGAAVLLAKKIFDSGAIYAKSSVALSDICQPEDLTADMFTPQAVQAEMTVFLSRFKAPGHLQTIHPPASSCQPCSTAPGILLETLDLPSGTTRLPVQSCTPANTQQATD